MGLGIITLFVGTSSDLQSWAFSDFLNLGNQQLSFGDSDQDAYHNELKIKLEPNRKSYNNSSVGQQSLHASHHQQSVKRPLAQSHHHNQQSVLVESALMDDDFLLGCGGDSNHQAKRLKCDLVSNRSTNTASKASPQLLQQLMAPASNPPTTTATVPSKQLSAKDNKANHSNSKCKAAANWNAENNTNVKGSLSVGNLCSSNNTTTTSSSNINSNKRGTIGQKKQLQQQQQQKQTASNSVLKNLLVSGCDVSAGYICLAPIRPKKLVAKV